ncbi:MULTISPECIES: hypothetical protein [Flavobacterium]|uniref:DUF2971 domain-containing protein n=1 Tax=Flavobacterium gawalongense TaxID=2594432 RepID=A0A553BL26_9FLAO|nr:hypothetical protein [Flavobacterium gawalongense]TRX00416.1 hypothetical protein FNW33_11965 [Flavobacterium gawalongense]TRX05037.1 hypothetical protein FNW12_12025 [Flavobacterium gawalongense]TRX08955.1 hypothetical protein FNW11_10450 [Flavobacterium gawalongense]TRX10058.1 hypothetical protein FNW10_10350 [Flavobacterium gawalongense]TRX26909.1 hypothetical protein FNW38_09960 [Flavobacterium gawalongense]
MYLNNSNIKLPEDSNTIVWKYLDLSKFLDLLLSQKLFMSRSDKFEDQYEGTFSEPTFEEIKKLSIDNPEFLNYYKTHREKVAISSWHINEYESFAMWQIFTQNSEGLAIQSTIGRLQNALQPETNFNQYIGEVNYIDYKKEYIPFDDMFFPFLFKRKSFQYEREVRIISDVADNSIKINDGLKINVDINELIEKIYIHPKSENWYKNLVIQLVKQLGFDFCIEKSDLESDILI